MGRDGSFGAHIAQFHHGKAGAGSHHPDGISYLHLALLNADVDNNPFVGIVVGVEDQCLQRRLVVSRRSRNVPDDALHDIPDIFPGFCTDPRGILCGNADDILDFLAHPLRVSAGQIDLIQNWHHFQIVVNGQIGVG